MLRKLWKHLLGRQSGSTKKSKMSLTFRPFLEQLERRLVPVTDVFWIGPTGGAWSDSANWSSGAVPDSTDDVYLGSAYTLSNDHPSVVDTSITVDAVITSSSYGGFAIGPTMSSSVTLSANGNITLAGTTVLGSSLGPTTVSAGGSLFVFGSVSTAMGASTTLSANGIVLESSSAFTVTSTGMAPTTFSAAGTVEMDGDLRVTEYSVLSISVPTGSATVGTGGTVEIADGATLSYSGYQPLAIDGTLTALAASPFGFGAASDLSVSPSVNVAGSLDVNDAASLTVSGTLLDQGDVKLESNTAVLTVSGEMNVNAELDLYAPASSGGMPSGPNLTVTGLMNLGSGAALWVYGAVSVPVTVISAGSHTGDFANINGEANNTDQHGHWAGSAYVYTG